MELRKWGRETAPFSLTDPKTGAKLIMKTTIYNAINGSFAGLTDVEVINRIVEACNTRGGWPRDLGPISGGIDPVTKKAYFSSSCSDIDIDVKHIRDRRWDIIGRGLEILEGDTRDKLKTKNDSNSSSSRT